MNNIGNDNNTTSPYQTTKRAETYTIVGTVVTIFNFLVYTFIARVIFNNNELLWLDSIIAYLISTFLAYFLHSRITWKESRPSKIGITNFFIWNFITAIIISPLLTWVFGFATSIYDLTFSISSYFHLPFDYNFIESTEIFIFTTIITMIFNYTFYNKFVFSTNIEKKSSESEIHTKFSQNKVSIIIPIYNTAKYLPACLNSVLKQTHQNLEVILIDDGSTDNSSQIAQQYAKQDARIQIITQKNSGQSAARNKGLSIATGTFVSFVDSDDQVKPTFISELLSSFNEQTSLSVCGIHYKRLKQKTANDVYINQLRSRNKNESKKAYILYLLALDGRLYSSVNKLYRTKIAQECHFDESLNFAEDTKFVLDYLKKSQGEISFVLQPLYIYNFGTDTSTIKSTAINWQNWQTSFNNLKKWLGKNPSFKEKFWLHMVYLRWRISYIRSKRRAK